MRARKGSQQAIVATPHKIARTVYHLLKTGESYVAQSAGEHEEQRRECELRQLSRRAQKLGYTLAPAPAPSALPAA
jgi:transposase